MSHKLSDAPGVICRYTCGSEQRRILILDLTGFSFPAFQLKTTVKTIKLLLSVWIAPSVVH
ncbi:MAG: hypothetical protein AAF652_08265 [Cyanobacteria bacterium P01_C01_bin.72]